jgi:multidrug efflux pump subunit AcrA (membrane-fusion protein)
LAGAIGSLFVMEADYQVVIHGKARPLVERKVFAPADGSVDQLLVNGGETVDEGQPLAKLKSPALELQIADLLGQADTLQNRRRAIRSERLQLKEGDAIKQSELVAEEQSISLQLANLKRQHELLQSQVRELTLASPIRGRIVDWDLAQTLFARPVTRGSALLTVAEIDGAWQLAFDVPDELAGDILQARESSQQPLAIAYVTVGDPEHSRTAELVTIHETSQWNAELRQSCVTLDATFDKDAVPGLRPGIEVVGKVNCGRRSIAYVWFHELYRELYRRWF